MTTFVVVIVIVIIIIITNCSNVVIVGVIAFHLLTDVSLGCSFH